MKTAKELDALLAKTVPVLVHRFMINSGAVKVCGAISDAFGAIAEDNGFEAYVASRPGHFVNEIVTKDGVYEVDLSAIQFECQDEEDVPGALERLTEDPYRAMRVRKLDGLSYSSREPAPDNPDFHYTPRKSYAFWQKMAERAGRGEYNPMFTWEISATGGKPFGYGVPWMTLGSLGLLGAAMFLLRRFEDHGYARLGA